MEIALQVRNLRKNYGATEVLKGIDFTVKTGEIFGILGANGAGKSTTLECIEGVKSYQHGEIEVFGQNIAKVKAAQKLIGVQLQSSALPKNITVEEAMIFFCQWKKIANRFDLLQTFGLDTLTKKQYHQLSVGQKRRLHLALALCDDPKIVILDEPTAGLDVQGRMELHQEIKKLKANGVTVLLASHDMAEVEMLCDRLLVIVKGEIKFMGTARAFKLQSQKEKKIKVKTTQNTLAAEVFRYSQIETQTDEGLTLIMSDLTKSIEEVLEKVRLHGDEIEDLTIEALSLEERFIEIAYTETEVPSDERTTV